MVLLLQTWEYFLAHQADFWAKTATYLRLSVVALLIGVSLGIILGIVTSQNAKAAAASANGIGALRAIPSIAIMAAMLPLIGIGFWPALIALTILAVPPVLINTQAGLAGVDPSVLEAARGMGMSRTQVIARVQFPLALPVIIAGARTAAVEVLASATIGSIIGAGGLGEYIFSGLSLGPSYIHLMLVGAIMVALLALTAEGLFTLAETLARRASHG
jgi:osmoprotectant transport system permease protein